MPYVTIFKVIGSDDNTPLDNTSLISYVSQHNSSSKWMVDTTNLSNNRKWTTSAPTTWKKKDSAALSSKLRKRA